jgi:hypothetical protein
MQMLRSFTDLLHASAAQLERLLLGDGRLPPSREMRREQKAQQLGVKTSQLVCGVGFNRHAKRRDDFAQALGYTSFEAFVGDRNYRFIHDNYAELSVNNIVDIYRVAGEDKDSINELYDPVYSRLSQLESQLEGTINPILVGGYKLEINNIYTNHLASPALIATRLQKQYSVLRDIGNDLQVMIETGTLTPERILRTPGVNAGEKSRLIFRGLISPEAVNAYLRDTTAPQAERDALANIALRKTGG